MNVSFNWLKRYIDTDLSAERIAEILTELGLEVEEFEKVESIKGGLKGVVVGEVLTPTRTTYTSPPLMLAPRLPCRLSAAQ